MPISSKTTLAQNDLHKFYRKQHFNVFGRFLTYKVNLGKIAVDSLFSTNKYACESLFLASLIVLIIQEHFRAPTANFSLNNITIQVMAYLENAVTHF